MEGTWKSLVFRLAECYLRSTEYRCFFFCGMTVMALKEFKDCKQDSGEFRKRWYSDRFIDCYTWERSPEEIVKIQVTFANDDGLIMWLWEFGKDGAFYLVEEGDNDPRRNRSPIIDKKIDFEYHNFLGIIERSSGELPIEVLEVFRTLA